MHMRGENNNLKNMNRINFECERRKLLYVCGYKKLNFKPYSKF